MIEPVAKKATYEDLCDLPENLVGEILDGELIATPRPSREHGHAASILGVEIIPPYHMGKGGPGGWIFIGEPEIALGADIVVPDLVGWRKERFPEKEDHNWISVVPDWICEIVSPGSIRLDRVKKMGLYARHLVPHYWLLDPFGKTLEVLKNESGRWLIIGTFAEDDKVRAEPFQEIEIDLCLLWLENVLRG